ncbi:MAG: DUF6440 family protein [Candidatus Spyradocola sp.]|jgi:hypothetical protein
MPSQDRFEKVFEQGMVNVTEIWVDRRTGVQYIFHASGNAGGLCPLLDADGRPLLCRKEDEDAFDQED